MLLSSVKHTDWKLTESVCGDNYRTECVFVPFARDEHIQIRGNTCAAGADCMNRDEGTYDDCVTIARRQITQSS